MKRFVVIGTSGKQISVMGPEDATQKEAQAAYDRYQSRQWYAKEQQERLREYDPRRIALREAYESLGPVDRFGVGIANPALETYEGAKQLVGLVGPETEERLRVARDTPVTPASIAGNVVSEIAQTAIPGFGIMRAARTPQVMTDVAVSAAQQGLKGVEDPEAQVLERLQNAALGGASALLGYAPGGVRPTPQAGELIRRAREQNVPMRLTPGQMGGPLARLTEQSMEALPVLGYAFRHHQNVGLQDWNRLVLNDVSPDGGIADVGTAGIRAVRDQFRNRYNQVIESAPERLTMDADQFYRIANIPQQHRDLLSSDQLEQVTSETDNLLNRLASGDIPRDDFKATKKQVNDLTESAYNAGNVRLGDAFSDLGDAFNDLFREQIPPDRRDLLDFLDERYGAYKTLLRAHAMKGAVTEGHITPNQLLGAIRAEDPSKTKMGFATETRPLQPETISAEESLGRMIPKMGPGTAEKVGQIATAGGLMAEPGLTAAALAAGTAGAGLTFPMAPVLRGQNPVQMAIDRALRIVPPGVISQPVEAGISGLLDL